jgi:hypothetical protein
MARHRLIKSRRGRKRAIGGGMLGVLAFAAWNAAPGSDPAVTDAPQLNALDTPHLPAEPVLAAPQGFTSLVAAPARTAAVKPVSFALPTVRGLLEQFDGNHGDGSDHRADWRNDNRHDHGGNEWGGHDSNHDRDHHDRDDHGRFHQANWSDHRGDRNHGDRDRNHRGDNRGHGDHDNHRGNHGNDHRREDSHHGGNDHRGNDHHGGDKHHDSRSA